MQRTSDEMAEIYQRNVETVYRLCVLFFKGSRMDAEDAVQNTFLRLFSSGKRFADAEHEKAYLIVTASNTCKDMLSSAWRRRVRVDGGAAAQLAAAGPGAPDETLSYIMELPHMLKLTIYMYYYEGYSAREIAKHLDRSVSTVWGYLHRGRRLLKLKLKEDSYEEETYSGRHRPNRA